jgi:hypothetical protein
MTIQEQVVFATDRVAHWNSKRDHALAMLTKWQARLSALQAKGKPQPTAKKLPAVTLVPGTEHLMPRAAVTIASDHAAAQHLARAAALRDIAEETGDSNGKVVPLKGKAGKAKKPQPKKR